MKYIINITKEIINTPNFPSKLIFDQIPNVKPHTTGISKRTWFWEENGLDGTFLFVNLPEVWQEAFSNLTSIKPKPAKIKPFELTLDPIFYEGLHIIESKKTFRNS